MSTTQEQLALARSAKKSINTATTALKNQALEAMANQLLKATEAILAANQIDMEAACGKISEVMLDRLFLDQERIAAMAKGIRALIDLPDPIGEVLDTEVLENGLEIQKVLRTGKDAFHSAQEIVTALKAGLEEAGLNPDLLQLIQDTSRASSFAMMKAKGYLDLLIPRGGAGLIQAVVENAIVPVIETGTGIVHVYVDKEADFQKALAIIENAKTSRPSVCNAMEVLLVDQAIAYDFLPLVKERLVDERERLVELRLDEDAQAIISGKAAQEQDFDTEFLDYILAIKVVDGVEEAVDHIEAHSTHHSDAIVTENPETATYFTKQVDSAAVYVNASTRFTDGGQFGLGCEMGISTQKLHARGPMGLREMTSYKYIVSGNGQVR